MTHNDSTPAERLLRVARALSEPSRSTAAFVTAIGGRVERAESRRVDFRLPDAAFPVASVRMSRRAEIGADPDRWPPEALELEPDSLSPPVTLSQLARELGSWHQPPPGPDGFEVHTVVFDEYVRAPVRGVAHGESPAALTHSVRVTAVLADDPRDRDVRVVRVRLFRDD